MKIGVFGGTFDPVHIGHLVAAEEVRVRLDLDEVLFIPAGEPWLKADCDVTAAHHRLRMVELAVESNAWFRVSDMEVKRPGPTYTVDTLEELRGRGGSDSDKDKKFYLPLGLDSLSELGRWHMPERIFELCTIIGLSRPGAEDFDAGRLDAVRPGASKKVRILDIPRIGVEGSVLRRRVSEGLSIKYQVPDPVEAYIYEHGLYR